MRLGRLPRSARLKRKRLIEPLFNPLVKRAPKSGSSGEAGAEVKSVSAGTIRVIYRFAPRSQSGFEAPVQVGFAVPKRVRRATVRNRIKRQMRAAFQSQAQRYLAIPVPADQTLTMMAIFRGDAYAPGVAEHTKRAFDKVAALGS